MTRARPGVPRRRPRAAGAPPTPPPQRSAEYQAGYRDGARAVLTDLGTFMAYRLAVSYAKGGK